MLSALYGYCKVQKLDGVSFKDIIAQYKRQPQATQVWNTSERGQGDRDQKGHGVVQATEAGARKGPGSGRTSGSLQEQAWGWREGWVW